jgi:hypothetical protein
MVKPAAPGSWPQPTWQGQLLCTQQLSTWQHHAAYWHGARGQTFQSAGPASADALCACQMPVVPVLLCLDSHQDLLCGLVEPMRQT